MWQAVETSIQTFNKNCRPNPGSRSNAKSATPVHPISRPTCSIMELMKKTNFSKDEIRHLYRTFKQDSPSGQVSKEHFASVFTTLFPTGECYRYAIFLFQNIDRANTNIIRFEDLVTTFSLLVHGSIEDRLGWIFDLYDINKDGIELFQLAASIFQLIVPVSKLNYTPVINAIEERTDELVHCAYIVDSNELTNNQIDQQLGLNLPSYYDRYVRTTKFPRIGRSPLTSEEISSLFDVNTSTSSEENYDEHNNYDNELRLMEQRSVFFPRIGKRAFHNLLWSNSVSNPHRMLDAEGRYYVNGYDYHIHRPRPLSMSRYRSKRNLPM
ncbi:unnamed protein product [Rotaria sp. Silwood2]|nr:unnamed protein product [Rotaria sp. Silwood2]